MLYKSKTFSGVLGEHGVLYLKFTIANKSTVAKILHSSLIQLKLLTAETPIISPPTYNFKPPENCPFYGAVKCCLCHCSRIRPSLVHFFNVGHLSRMSEAILYDYGLHMYSQ